MKAVQYKGARQYFANRRPLLKVANEASTAKLNSKKINRKRKVQYLFLKKVFKVCA